jgi:hypothetical protein
VEIIPVLLFLGPCWFLAGWHYWFGIRRHFASEKLRVLNLNLAKAGLYWSNVNNEVQPLEGPDSLAKDRAKYVRHFLIFTSVLTILSVVGMILLGLIFLTSRSRLEIRLMESRLASDSGLQADEIQPVLEEVRRLV